MRRRILVLLAALFVACAADAATIEQPLADPVQEQQARALFYELRCAVCEGQSLADSDASLAVEMRAYIRRLVASGATPDEILSKFRASYGDRILMKPPLDAQTVALWFAPILLLIGGGVLVWRATRQGVEHHA